MGEVAKKLKLLYLLKFLSEESDEDNPVTMQRILEYLEARGITAERKSIYRDVESLRTFGYDIIGTPVGKGFTYHMGSRDFELAELKLLVDSVQSAKFISERKSNELIKKLEGLTSKYEGRKLQRQVFVSGRVKSDNEQILYNIDAIHRAIASNSKLCFQYFYLDMNKKKVARHGGKVYEVSPWGITLADENYYMVSFEKNAEDPNDEGQIRYFRIDKIMKPRLKEVPREGYDKFKKFDVAEYAKKRFNMFNGEEVSVRLHCKESFAGVIFDRFGKDLILIPNGDGFNVSVDVAVSDQFFGWIMAMSEGIRIIAPESVVEQAKNFVRRASNVYGV